MKLSVADFFSKAHIDRDAETRVTSVSSLLGILRDLTPLQFRYNVLTQQLQ